MKEQLGNILDFLRRHKVVIGAVVFFWEVILWGPTIYANLSTRNERFDINKTNIQNIPKRKVAIVFGAGIYSSGTPTPYLQWRIETAAKLFCS